MSAALEQPAVEPVAWKHDCAALLTNDVELWVDRCPHCGKPRAAPQPQQPDARTAAIQECIDRLIKGGKPAEAQMLRNHFGVTE